MAPEYANVNKTQTEKMAEQCRELYASVKTHIRTKLRLALSISTRLSRKME